MGENDFIWPSNASLFTSHRILQIARNFDKTSEEQKGEYVFSDIQFSLKYSNTKPCTIAYGSKGPLLFTRNPLSNKAFVLKKETYLHTEHSGLLASKIWGETLEFDLVYVPQTQETMSVSLMPINPYLDCIDAAHLIQDKRYNIEIFMYSLAIQLHCIHSLGIIHRDIKYDNIMFKKAATSIGYVLTPWLIDFGAAKLTTPHTKHTFESFELAGSYPFMDPSNLMLATYNLTFSDKKSVRLKYNKSSDIYGLGVTFFGLWLLNLDNQPYKLTQEEKSKFGRDVFKTHNKRVTQQSLMRGCEEMYPVWKKMDTSSQLYSKKSMLYTLHSMLAMEQKGRPSALEVALQILRNMQSNAKLVAFHLTKSIQYHYHQAHERYMKIGRSYLETVRPSESFIEPTSTPFERFLSAENELISTSQSHSTVSASSASSGYGPSN